MHPRHLLRRYGLHPRKSLGQHFLVDEGVLRSIVAAADLTSADTVIEVGPGLGALTRHLAASAGQVIAVEVDERLIPVLEDQLADAANVRLLCGDILDLDLAAVVDGPYKVVANLPYYITGAVLRHLLSGRPRPVLMVLTVQREVAQRLNSGPGRMSLLAVAVQYYGRVRVVRSIKAGSFYPRPEVDSTVVRVDVGPEPLVSVTNEQLFFRVVKAGFAQRRKQLRNSLGAGLAVTAADAHQALIAAGIDPRRRAQTLSVEEWGRLTAAVMRLRSSAADPAAG